MELLQFYKSTLLSRLSLFKFKQAPFSIPNIEYLIQFTRSIQTNTIKKHAHNHQEQQSPSYHSKLANTSNTSSSISSCSSTSTLTPSKYEQTYLKQRQQNKIKFDLFHSPPVLIRKTFNFTTAVSGIPKKQMKPQKTDLLSVQVGEDAFFIRKDALGVADGVGGWNEVPGANPSLYSQKLMHYCCREFEDLELDDNGTTSDYQDVLPALVMRKGYDLTSRDCRNENILGSCTALIALLREDELRVANLGDCGLIVIRKDQIIFRTEEQQHAFNFPYQLGVGSKDTPEDAFTCNLTICEGDVVVIGSDGLFDNVFDEDIVSMVSQVRNSQSTEKLDPKSISDALLAKARETGESRHSDSPFSVKALSKGFFYQGGKMDDMTVLVAIVKQAEDSPDRR